MSNVSLIDGHIDPDKNRLTDKEIIKALECCITTNKKYKCEDCPYRKILGLCFDRLNKDAIDLINRQQATIERLNEDKSFLKDEFERFRIRVLPIAKTEAIKEFAERLKELKEMPLITNNDIDNLVKEMVGEDK